MKYLEEYRDAAAVKMLAAAIRREVTRPWTLMEVCGGQTHAILRFGLDTLLPEEISLVHGPGCPVCVTPVELVDRAIAIASRPGTILCSFGDMLRVPGSTTDLLKVRAAGGDVRIVYSPLDAVKTARASPEREVVFFAVGFETTAPANAGAVLMARQLGLRNFSILVSQVLVPPAMESILSAPGNRVRGFLAAGHVCTITGYAHYHALAARYHVPIVVTGFEPVDILRGVLCCVRQLESGRAEVENAYARAVTEGGNAGAQRALDRVFRVVDRKWRGIGGIAASGYALQPEFAGFDAETRFGLSDDHHNESGECISGLVLQGLKKPHECPAFGSRCTPESPLGATMVSSEGACAAYFKYRVAGTDAR